ncbi:plasmid pRiA4b ORF-3 family protein [Paraburkholderia tropica]|uniref:plasmid pRiA4b ORF-3 family protein n=1 Tax=Paraburkholderia tropica TaxID=92647 RepID=UPI00301B15F0
MRIIVPGSIRLGKLHVVLLAMGWDGGHPHEFVFGETNYGEPDDFGFQSDPSMLNEARVTLPKALRGSRSFTYNYDYGDNWQNRVKVEKALVPDPDMRRPLCVDGQNARPPEDVGGVPGYADFLEAIGDSAHEEHDHFLEWCGGNFEAAAFDLVLTNQRLSVIKF